ncbi:MAG TPA: NAD-dependent epimerase/dehydratase family protein, partial [Kofleriaceae bacterium]|nr:NAD-dependent epimerase/dehydratase family protein [Kofleriaceae bacterium]
PVIQGDGQQTRDLIYIDNVVAAILAACEADCPEPLNVASGEAVAINFLWTMILELSGKKRLAIEPTYVPAPPWDPKHARPQIQRSCKALGWAPSVRLRDGLARTVNHYVSARSADPNAWFAPKEDDRKPAPRRPVRPPIAAPRPGQSSRTATPPPLPPVSNERRGSSFGPMPKRPAQPPIVQPARPAEFLDADELDVVEEPHELDIEWAPVPAVPGLGR